MERMNTPQLEELLRRDFRAAAERQADMSELYCAAQVLAEREPGSGAAADRAWQRFQERYLPVAKVRSGLYEDGVPPSSDAAHGRHHSPLRRWGRRCGLAAAVLAAVLLLASATEEPKETIDSIYGQRRGRSRHGSA